MGLQARGEVGYGPFKVSLSQTAVVGLGENHDDDSSILHFCNSIAICILVMIPLTQLWI